MTNEFVPANARRSFEELKRLNPHGAEYWSARDLQPLLGYSQWRCFDDVVKRAITSCKQSGNDPSYHFAGVGKPIPGGKGAVQVVPDYHLSRFACYLIAQNGDSRKPEIAYAQKYFAVQTRDKLKCEGIRGEEQAINVHHQVGKEVRAAIQRIGGTPPEQLPAAEHIKEVKKRLIRAKPRLELEEKDAKGLVGTDRDGK